MDPLIRFLLHRKSHLVRICVWVLPMAFDSIAEGNGMIRHQHVFVEEEQRLIANLYGYGRLGR